MYTLVYCGLVLASFGYSPGGAAGDGACGAGRKNNVLGLVTPGINTGRFIATCCNY